MSDTRTAIEQSIFEPDWLTEGDTTYEGELIPPKHGPYFPGQCPYGWLKFHGPNLILPGPQEPWIFECFPHKSVTGGYTVYP